MKKYEVTGDEDMQPVPVEEPNDDPMVGIPEVEGETSKEGFPPECAQPMRGLLFLGCLTKKFNYAGHEFLIETLTEGMMLKVGQLMSEYKGTFSELEARKTFTVAACVKAVDGYPLVTNIQPTDTKTELLEKIGVVEQWYPPVVDYVFRRYRELETTEFDVANALKK